MIDFKEIWSRTWAAHLVTLGSTMGVPVGIQLVSTVLPIVLAPLFALLALFLCLVGFSGWHQHLALQAVPGLEYDVQRHLYYIVKWSLIHVGVSIAALPVAFGVLQKYALIPFVPSLGSSAIVYVVFMSSQQWVIQSAEEEIRSAS